MANHHNPHLLPQNYQNPDIQDSKKLSAKKRDYLYEIIRDVTDDWAIAVVGPQIIDVINIREATKKAMSRALASLDDLLGLTRAILIDGAIGLFSKGREHEAEIATARENWDFEVQTHPSKFGDQSMILEISHAKPKKLT